MNIIYTYLNVLNFKSYDNTRTMKYVFIEIPVNKDT